MIPTRSLTRFPRVFVFNIPVVSLVSALCFVVLFLPQNCPANDIARAVDLLDRATKAAASIPNEADKAATLTAIAMVKVKAGDYKGAVQTASLIRYEDDFAHMGRIPYKALALAQVAQAQAEIGDLKDALKTASGIQPSHIEAFALELIATTQADRVVLPSNQATSVGC